MPLLHLTTITCFMVQKAPMIDMNSAQQKYLYSNEMWNKFNIVAGKSVNLFFFSSKEVVVIIICLNEFREKRKLKKLAKIYTNGFIYLPFIKFNP